MNLRDRTEIEFAAPRPTSSGIRPVWLVLLAVTLLAGGVGAGLWAGGNNSVSKPESAATRYDPASPVDAVVAGRDLDAVAILRAKSLADRAEIQLRQFARKDGPEPPTSRDKVVTPLSPYFAVAVSPDRAGGLNNSGPALHLVIDVSAYAGDTPTEQIIACIYGPVPGGAQPQWSPIEHMATSANGEGFFVAENGTQRSVHIVSGQAALYGIFSKAPLNG